MAMGKLNYTEAFKRYSAVLDNPNWAVSAISSDGALVISCWEQYFKPSQPGVLIYGNSLSRWKGHNKPGLNLLRKHLERTDSEDLAVRLVMAKTSDPGAVDRGGDASKLKNTFSVREDLIGKLTSFDGDNYRIEFRKACRRGATRSKDSLEGDEMARDEDLHVRETARRKALWALAGLTPGDARADAILNTLDELERQELTYPAALHALTTEEVIKLVPIQAHPIGMNIVRDEDIPQPWRDRFLCASQGSTRLQDGAYFRDWERFLTLWQEEMAHLKQHRSARQHE